MKPKYILLLVVILFCINLNAQAPDIQKAVISVERIWDRAEHNAFTDLISFREKLYCTFREGNGHVPGYNGTIRVIATEDGQNWYSVALLAEDEVDLRDPKISETPDGRLMLTMGGSYYEGDRLIKREPRVAFSDKKGQQFFPAQKVVLPDTLASKDNWLWRISWHKKVGYGTVYQVRKEDDWKLHLVKTKDGKTYEFITTFDIKGKPSETTLRFGPNDEMLALVRRDSLSRQGVIGRSLPPYQSWKLQDLEARVGGPNFLRLPNGDLLCGSRDYQRQRNRTTALAFFDTTGSFNKVLSLPSHGDTSYPGLVVQGDDVYVSYYSHHEDKTAIYLAKVSLKELKALHERSQYLDRRGVFVNSVYEMDEFRMPAMITTLSKTLLTVSDARIERAGDVPNNIDLVIRRSMDNGHRWDSIRTIVNYENQEGATGPQLIQDKETGRVFLFYTYCPGKNEVTEGPEWSRKHLFLHSIYSDDDGETWSAPTIAEYGLKKRGWNAMWTSPGRGSQLSNGRLIVPINISAKEQVYAHYLYSDDHGESWSVSSPIGAGIEDPSLVELSNDSLLLIAKNQSGKRVLFRSRDQGETWTKISDFEELIDPGSQGNFLTYPYKGGEVLLFSNPDHAKKHRNLTVKASFDHGKTWPVKKLIWPGPSANSCLSILPDGKIGLLYENGQLSPQEQISFTSFSMDWLLSEKGE